MKDQTDLMMKDSETSKMKHPDPALETVVYNLGQAIHLVCSEGQKICGKCESCKVRHHLSSVKKWFNRAGHLSRRRFLVGLLQRIHSVEQLQYIIKVLQPLMSSKDFMYARSRCHTSIATDSATTSSNRALNEMTLETSTAEVWVWYQAAPYWSKCNFLLAVLQLCEGHELMVVANQAFTLLAAEERAFTPHDNYETSSIASSTYSYQTDSDDLLSTVCRGYSSILQDPFSAVSDLPLEKEREASESQPSGVQVSSFCLGDDEIINDDSRDEEWFGEEDDPVCLVLPGSSKAFSGVSRHKDFIRLLPVHLSKLILGFLDRVSLYNCLCVSRHWRLLTEEVHKEYFVQQHLWEEVMLMQGAAAQGCNPVYANDIDVVVPNLMPNSFDVKPCGDNEVDTKFKSEASFAAGYSGVSTRSIIMEERNVYCGPYNVMVLLSVPDPSRILHTDGGPVIALGSADRKIRFVACETGKEESLVITGHAGSVRCVALAQSRGVILSGSYDTSIRKWSLTTGKCQKIFRGHRDTLLCLQIYQNYVASGAKDNMCKVWDFDTGKCLRTFKHRHPVTAVAIGEEELCVSGCEAGKVKVWYLPTGKLIKRLTGHQAAVTGICFDKWHIVTASKDGYALVWSAQGNHTRCLIALRHPTEVLSVEFMYLRVITGSSDGKIRIWNMITGQCLRIMRGNSRSDPITQLLAIDNRITINTPNNLLVLNFEPIDYDYTLETDKMPPLVQYGKYSDAPVRQQPYSYIRAQRMQLAGAANTKLTSQGITRETKSSRGFHQRKPEQVPHSAKCLSERSMTAARCIQSAVSADRVRSSRVLRESHSAPVLQKRQGGERSERKAASASGVSRAESKRENLHVAEELEEGAPKPDQVSSKRRVSWAFENPLKAYTEKPLDLDETKSLLRSQIRAKTEVNPPDFIYLAVSSIQKGLKKQEPTPGLVSPQADHDLVKRGGHRGRPSSSPCHIDPRTRMAVTAYQLDQLRFEKKAENTEMNEVIAEAPPATAAPSAAVLTDPPSVPTSLTIVTAFAPKPVETKSSTNLRGTRVKTSIPRPRLLRPHTASVMTIGPGKSSVGNDSKRPRSAALIPQQFNSKPDLSALRSNMAGLTSAIDSNMQEKHSTSAQEISHVPMLMYPPDLNAKLKARKQTGAPALLNKEGHVSPSNHPFRTHVNFRLLTHEQVAKLGALSKSSKSVSSVHLPTQKSDITAVEALS